MKCKFYKTILIILLSLIFVAKDIFALAPESMFLAPERELMSLRNEAITKIEPGTILTFPDGREMVCTLEGTLIPNSVMAMQFFLEQNGLAPATRTAGTQMTPRSEGRPTVLVQNIFNGGNPVLNQNFGQQMVFQNLAAPAPSSPTGASSRGGSSGVLMHSPSAILEREVIYKRLFDFLLQMENEILEDVWRHYGIGSVTNVHRTGIHMGYSFILNGLTLNYDRMLEDSNIKDIKERELGLYYAGIILMRLYLSNFNKIERKEYIERLINRFLHERAYVWIIDKYKTDADGFFARAVTPPATPRVRVMPPSSFPASPSRQVVTSAGANSAASLVTPPSPIRNMLQPRVRAFVLEAFPTVCQNLTGRLFEYHKALLQTPNGDFIGTTMHGSVKGKQKPDHRDWFGFFNKLYLIDNIISKIERENSSVSGRLLSTRDTFLKYYTGLIILKLYMEGSVGQEVLNKLCVEWIRATRANDFRVFEIIRDNKHNVKEMINLLFPVGSPSRVLLPTKTRINVGEDLDVVTPEMWSAPLLERRENIEIRVVPGLKTIMSNCDSMIFVDRESMEFFREDNLIDIFFKNEIWQINAKKRDPKFRNAKFGEIEREDLERESFAAALDGCSREKLEKFYLRIDEWLQIIGHDEGYDRNFLSAFERIKILLRAVLESRCFNAENSFEAVEMKTRDPQLAGVFEETFRVITKA